MITIADTLRPDHVALDVRRQPPESAIGEVAALLRTDERILDWDAVLAGFFKVAPCLPASSQFAICIPHTRTDRVTSLVMSVGRSADGIMFPGTPVPVRYLFCIGVQLALAADYLRIVGLLARIVKDPASEERLRTAATGLEFVQALSRLEAKL
ncbi:MAG TPA: PTS sugar transporter subunit IIA [Chthoniobacteraceae bacterium]|nr:PTS sugar transporter subunit IIA [Chthoniobacteraceae bacterium]